MGCVYAGYRTNRRKNGFFKIGMTEKSNPSQRLTTYKLQGLFYLEIPKATKAELLYIESSMRVSVEHIGLRLDGNDCFQYAIDPLHNQEQIQMIAGIALRSARQACINLHLKYQVINLI